MWTQGSRFRPAEACGGPAHSKHAVAIGICPEGEVAAALERRAPREAGNRAALMVE